MVSATTGQMTHRHLRLSLVFVVFALLTGIAIETVVVSWEPLELGWQVLPSLSHYFYTPARSVFVGALVAASLALLALSGRDRTTVLLDVAAIFAPLIALVPTGLSDGDTRCPGTEDCIPPAFLDDVRTGVATYVLVVISVVLVTAVIRARRGTTSLGAAIVSVIAVATALLLAALAFVPALNAGFPFNLGPSATSIHFVVTLIFFGTFAAVPILHARGSGVAGETPPTARQRRVYLWVAGLLIADLVLLVIAFAARASLPDIPVVLIGETVALLLFAVFWWVQTFQRWDDADPPSIR